MRQENWIAWREKRLQEIEDTGRTHVSDRGTQRGAGGVPLRPDDRQAACAGRMSRTSAGCARSSGRQRKQGCILGLCREGKAGPAERRRGRHQGVIAFAAAYAYAEDGGYAETGGGEGRRSVS